MDLYAQNIIDHYKNPRNNGDVKGADVKHQEANYSCGDIIDVDLKFNVGVISEVAFRGEGCAVSIAGTSILTEFVKNKKVKEVLALQKKDVKKIHGIEISQRREKCALLGLLSIQNAILTFQKKPTKKFSELLSQ